MKNFKSGIRAADTILIATPEYNYSIPGVLRNAIDWASRVTDGHTRDKSGQLLQTLVTWARRLRAPEYAEEATY